MQVYIYDVDFLNDGSPNFLAMRISSYHKQLGDSVTLLRPKDKLPKKFDKVYVFQSDATLPKPPTSLLMNKAASVYGVRYFTNWTPSDAQLACRPDYLLYPRGRNKFERSDAVQLGNERGGLLKWRQDDTNIETNKDTVVTDEQLWLIPSAQLVNAFQSLKKRKNIYFLRPISLARLISDQTLREAFMDLNFANGKMLQWTNALPFVEEKVDQVFAFFDEFKARHSKTAVGAVEFYPQTVSRPDVENLKLCVKTILGMKERCWKVTISKLDSRLDSVYVHYYELLHNWSMQPHVSFFEFIAQTPAKRLGMTVEEFYCHPELWGDEMFRAGIELYHHLEEWGFEEPQTLARWRYGDKYWDVSNVNWQALLRSELWY